jgi:hypothetical protein
MIHKCRTNKQETFRHTVTEVESTLHSNAGSVSIRYEAVFTDILCTIAQITLNEYQMPVITQFSIRKT